MRLPRGQERPELFTRYLAEITHSSSCLEIVVGAVTRFGNTLARSRYHLAQREKMGDFAGGIFIAPFRRQGYTARARYSLISPLVVY